MSSTRARSLVAIPFLLLPLATLGGGVVGEAPATSARLAALAPVAAAPPAPAVELDPGLELARACAEAGGPFTPGRSPFIVTLGEQVVPYQVFAVQALPGEAVELSAPGALTLRYRDEVAVASSDGWVWTAPPRPGIVPLLLVGPEGDVRLNVLVMHLRTEQRGESLNGYRIGRYVAKPLCGSPRYLPSEGFVELGKDDMDVLVSPHLTLGQFPCKQPGDPRYLHVTAGLLLKLETILEAANEAGYYAPTLHVISGFRTPAYNAAIGNETVYSRHLWGDAADVWVDADGDGEMDDWSGDGRVDMADIRILIRIVEQAEKDHQDLVGGIGLYRRNSAYGPFVHVDARGWVRGGSEGGSRERGAHGPVPWYRVASRS